MGTALQFKGHSYRRRPSLTWRDAEEGDTYKDGGPIPEHHVVIVRKKDCPVVREQQGIRYIDPDGVKHIPLAAHHYTYMARGPVRCRQQQHYYVLYLVQDGEVYAHSVNITPAIAEKLRARESADAPT